MRERSSGRDRDEAPRRDRDDGEPRGRREVTRGRDHDDEPRGGRERGRNEEADAPRGRGREESSGRGGRDREDSGRGSSRGSGYEYQARSADDTRARAAAGANDFDKLLIPGCKQWKPNDGDNTIRILPPTWKGAKHFGVDCHVHYGVGADNGAYLDLHKMKGEDDPIHEEYLRAKDELDPDNKDDQEYLRQLRGTRRDLIYLIDRDHEKEGVQAWMMPFGLGNDIVKLSIDKKTGEVLPIDHPEEGFDVEFTKTGAKKNTKYSAPAIARRSSPLGDDRWLEHALKYPLPDQLQYFDYDHIAKAFGGGGAHKEKPRGGRDDERDNDRGRGRDDEPRGGRDRDRDDPPARGHDRDEPVSRGRGREEPANDEPTWESVHAMTGKELDALVEQEQLSINPDEAKDDEDLADWICEEMKLKKVERSSARRTVADDDSDDQADRLKNLRSRRD